VLTVWDFLAGPQIVVAGLIAVGPCLAAISGSRRSVIAVGGYVVGLIQLVSWPDQMWWTRQQLLYVVAAVAITAASAVSAHQRTLGEQRRQIVMAHEGGVRRAGEQARRTAEYSRSLLEASTDPLVTISADGKITDANAATTSVTGVPGTELIGTDFSDYFTDPTTARQGYEEVFAADPVTDYPLTIRHRDGRLTDVLYNAAVYLGADGQVAGVFAAARDVTALKQAEANFRGLLEGAPDAIVVVDGDGVLRIVNRQTGLLFRYSREELLEKPIEVLVPDRAGPAHRGLRTSYMTAPERRPMGIGLQLNGRCRDGTEFPAEISLAPGGHSAGNLCVGRGPRCDIAASDPRGIGQGQPGQKRIPGPDEPRAENAKELQVLTALRTDPRTVEIPVAVLSEDDQPRQSRKVLGAGAQLHLPKPLDVRTLLDFLETNAQP